MFNNHLSSVQSTSFSVGNDISRTAVVKHSTMSVYKTGHKSQDNFVNITFYVLFQMVLV